MRIEDGTGSGNKLKVDDHGRALTLAIKFSHEAHHSSYHSDFYTVTADTILAGTSETPCLILVNDSDKDMEIYWSTVAADSDVKLAYYVDSGYTSGGTEKTSVNMNRSSSLSASVTAYEGGATANLVVDTTDELNIKTLYQGANTHEDYDFKGALILPKNGSVVIKATGIASDNVSVSLSYAFHTAGQRI